MLTVIYLKRSLDAGHAFNFQAPKASPHARWISRIIYALKIP